MEQDPRTLVVVRRGSLLPVTRLVFQPTPQSEVERSDEVGVSVVVVDATRRRMDCTKSTVSDSISVVAEEMQSGVDGCVDFAGEVAVVVTSPTVLAGVCWPLLGWRPQPTLLRWLLLM